MNYYFVNQKNYNDEKNESCLWAPLKDKGNKKVWHWDMLDKLKEGDIVFHNCYGKIMAISVVKCESYLSDIPKVFKQKWNTEGRRVDVKYYELLIPLKISDYIHAINKYRVSKQYPFDKRGRANQIYIANLPKKLGDFFFSCINQSNKNEILEESENLLIETDEVLIEKEQKERINFGNVRVYSKEEIEKKEREIYEYKISNNQKSYRPKTDERLKATVLEMSNYKCSVDSNHVTFLNVKGNQYMECHHLIPMQAQKDFKNIRLDSIFNIMPLCPTCHAKIHYGTKVDKKELFKKLFSKYEDKFKDKGFDEKSMDEIFKKYYVK